MKRALLTLFLVLAGLLFSAKNAHAYLVHEVGAGILEVRGVQDEGLIVESIHIDDSGRWIYLAVKEVGLMSRFSNSNLKYFYAPSKSFKFSRNQRCKFIRYGIGKRILNSKGKIPFGTQHYFYPLVAFHQFS